MFDNQDLLHILKQFVELRSVGVDEFDAPCPFCKGLGVHFKVWKSADEWVWECSKQTLGGNREDFIGCVNSELAGVIPDKKKRHKEFDPYADHVILPAPDDQRIEIGQQFTAWNPKEYDNPAKQFVNYKPDMVFPYRTREGHLLGYVIRINIGKRKITPLICWVKRPTGDVGWCHFVFPTPSPIYGAERLNASGQVVVVEGEKAADAGQRLLGMPCVSWQGGGPKAHLADWSQLRGRNVVLVPDADYKLAVKDGDFGLDIKKGDLLPWHLQPGQKAMLLVAQELTRQYECTVKIIDTRGKASADTSGWDIADAEQEGLSKQQVLAWMKPLASVYEAPEEAPPVDDYEGQAPEETEAVNEADDEPAAPYDPNANGTPFRFLGYNAGSYFYLPESTQQIVSLTPSMHTAPNLISMAPLDYWEKTFPAKHQPDWLTAQNALMNRSTLVGVFESHQTIRGRGAWIDNDEVIIHTGPNILVNGHMKTPSEFDSKYVYEKAGQLAITKAQPSTNQEAHRLVQICERLTWETPLSGAMLAGWCVIAAVCGILKWRPHIWVTGQHGSGKSTVLRDIIKRIVGEVGLYMDGDTTEAGIRQSLNRDARPIIFDEAESEDRQDASRMKKVLSLARKASSGGTVVKGTTHGDPITYTVRSAFCFSSINTSVQHAADDSRISKLVLIQNRNSDREQHYKDIMRDIIEWFTPEYSARMFSRTVANIDNLLANCETFIDAAALTLGNRRAADQIGPMLAGYYLCHKTDRVTLERAIKEIEDNNWDEHTSINSAGDGVSCLEVLTSHKMRVYVTSETKERTFTVGELIVLAAGGLSQSVDASDALKAIGVIVDRVEGEIIISKNSKPLDDIYEGTPWTSGDARTRQLKTLSDQPLSKTKYFSSSVQKSRGVVLSVGLVEG